MRALKVKIMNNRTAKTLLLLALTSLASACSTKVEQWTYPEYIGVRDATVAPDPPCTVAGFFRSNTPGKYYKCVYSNTHGRWVKTILSCPTGQNFDEAAQRCK